MSNLAGFQMKLYSQIAFVVVFFDRRDVKSFASKVLMVVGNLGCVEWQRNGFTTIKRKDI